MRKALLLTILTVGLMSLPASASAQASAELDARPLPERIAEPSPQGPNTDTALLFTNLGMQPASVKLQAWNADGEQLATGEFSVPANGLVYILASRLAQEAGVDRFVGHVKAKASGYVVGSTVVIGSRLTDIDTINSHNLRRRRNRDVAVTSPPEHPATTSRMVFPVVATY